VTAKAWTLAVHVTRKHARNGSYFASRWKCKINSACVLLQKKCLISSLWF